MGLGDEDKELKTYPKLSGECGRILEQSGEPWEMHTPEWTSLKLQQKTDVNKHGLTQETQKIGKWNISGKQITHFGKRQKKTNSSMTIFSVSAAVAPITNSKKKK